MKNIDKLTERFNSLYDSFITGCDAIEESGEWDKEKNGEMEAFYTDDLACVIISLIAADGKITAREVEYLNKTFDFDYSVEELKAAYKVSKDDIERSIEENFASGIAYMREINSALADVYKEMLALICDIIIESDGVISDEELKVVGELKSRL